MTPCCFSRPDQRKAGLQSLPGTLGGLPGLPNLSGRASVPKGLPGTPCLGLWIFHEAKQLHPDREDVCQAGDQGLGRRWADRTRDPSTPPTSGGCGRKKRRKVLDPRVLIPQVCYMNSKLTFFNFCLFFFFFLLQGLIRGTWGFPG